MSTNDLLVLTFHGPLIHVCLKNKSGKRNEGKYLAEIQEQKQCKNNFLPLCLIILV